jgi:hypothetical protein
MTKRLPQAGWLLRLASLFFAGALAITTVTLRQASAQSTDDPWDVPLNISHSGGAATPAIIVDSDSTVHVVWQDAFANYVETRFEAGQWSAPQSTSLHVLFGEPGSDTATDGNDALPYTGPNPLFVASDRPYIFAFWITPEGKLYTSRVLNTNFATVGLWTSRNLLSDSAASMAAAVDARGDIHVAYFRTADASGRPAGIYHTSLAKFGRTWSVPKLLYGSPYFRGLAGGKANLTLATAGTVDAPLVYVAWDNRPRKQVLLAKSADGGANWEQPVQVAGPTPDSGLAGPYNIRVGASENNAVLIWQNGPPGGACTQFYQYSGDAGATWSEAQLMLEDLAGCAESNEFVVGRPASPAGLLYLLTNTKSQIFLSAWNGSQWSEPEEQLLLSGFEDPEIYSRVIYDCQKATWLGERLYVVGCDTGGGGDIWLTSRDVEASKSWFSPPVWSRPAAVTGENFEVSNVVSVATADKLIHVFFSKLQDSAIYYTRWDGTAWSRITPVLVVPDGEADWPAVAAGPANELLLIARSNSGSLYFSRAISSDAVTASGWSTPTRLQITHDGRISPADIAWEAAGTVTLAYSVTVNDERGVYLVQSKDKGKTWSEPLQVFDGASADFELVGSPSLMVSVDGSMHVIWRQQSIRVDGFSETLALYYARSEDAGQSFSKAGLVVEAPVVWREIVADGQGNLHRLWQRSDMKSTLWDQLSLDGGQTWQAAQRLPAEEGIAAVTADRVGRLHLVDAGLGSVGHWVWDKGRWRVEAPLRWSMAAFSQSPVASLAAAVNIDGKLVVVISAPTGAGDGVQRLLLYTSRTLDLPAGQAAIQKTIAQSPPSPTRSAAIFRRRVR